MNLLRLALAVVVVGCVPGWGWSRALYAGYCSISYRLLYSVALSAALVPVATLTLARIAGSGVTVPIVVLSVAAVSLSGLVVSTAFGPAQGHAGDISQPLTYPPAPRLELCVLVPLAFSSGLMLAVLLGIFPASGGLLLVSAPLVYAAISLRIDGRAAGDEKGAAVGMVGTSVGQRESGGVLSPGVHKAFLGAVLVLVLFRGYSGPVLNDWPFIRGVDQYNHAVMANEMLSDGRIFPYLIYPPGFHTMTANISILSGLEPLRIFPILAPAILMLPALSLYGLARRIWGPDYGLAAAGFAGLLLGGPYQYFSDAMYPNMFTSQFILVMVIASLIELYSRPSLRVGLLFAVLAASVVLYHQVASLYLALLLIPIGGYFLDCFYRRDRRRGAAMIGSLLSTGILSAIYAWDTYGSPRLASGTVYGSGDEDRTGSAIRMVVGTQPPFSPLDLAGQAISLPVTWMGLLGAIVLLKAMLGGTHQNRRRTGGLTCFVYFLIIAWVFVFALGAVNPLTGFPQRFARDLGMPLALLAAAILVSIFRAPAVSARNGGLIARLALGLAIFLTVSVVGLQATVNLQGATGTRTPLTFTAGLTVTPEIAAAGKWLKENNTKDGNIMVSPQGNQVPSRMMLAMGNYSGMQSYPANSILWKRDLPPAGPDAMLDVLHVMENPARKETIYLLQEYDVQYLVLYKDMPDRSVIPYWRGFADKPVLYRTVFENEDVLIVEPGYRELR